MLVYDVSDDRRRARLHSLLKLYGVPVQLSAFEARLTPRERQQLLRRVADLVDASTDRFILYTVARDQEPRIVAMGRPRPATGYPGFYIA